MQTLRELAAEAAFPVFAVSPTHWTGPSFVGDTERREGTLGEVMLVYLDPTGERGFAVASMASSEAGVDDDLTRFVARFRPQAVTRRIKRRKAAFPPHVFDEHAVDGIVQGRPVTLKIMVHKDLPLNVIPLSLMANGRSADVWTMGWEVEVRDFVALLQPVDLALATLFDRPAAAPYDPPDLV